MMKVFSFSSLSKMSSIVAPGKLWTSTTPFFPEKRSSRIPFIMESLSVIVVFKGYWPWIVVSQTSLLRRDWPVQGTNAGNTIHFPFSQFCFSQLFRKPRCQNMFPFPKLKNKTFSLKMISACLCHFFYEKLLLHAHMNFLDTRIFFNIIISIALLLSLLLKLPPRKLDF